MVPVRIHRVLDHDYPRALRELRSPPDPVCVRGDLPGAPGVAIVGTRQATAEALSFAHDLASRLVGRGVAVWSGGAIGIDAAAHRGALDAGGISVAVVPTGLDHCYPKVHRPLYEEIVQKGGAIVSPFEPTSKGTLPMFHQRNAVLAALTAATVVIQAPFKSGARSTAAHARKLRRPLFIVPSAPWVQKGEGNLLELRLRGTTAFDEAALLRVIGVAKVRKDEHLVRLGAGTSTSTSTGTRTSTSTSTSRNREVLAGLSPVCLAVFDAASTSPRHSDDLCSKTGLGAALVQGALLTLTLHAVLVEGPSGWFRRSS
jgi:DNA processing protein